MTLEEHILSLPSPPVLDVLGKFVHLLNARTGTTSMDEGPLKERGIHRRRDRRRWETVWREIIVPKIGAAQGAPVFFTFVRNPWDRICSAFHHCRDRARTPSNKIDPRWNFTDWVKEFLCAYGPKHNRHFAEQYPTAFFDGDEFAFIGRFEQMEEDWKCVAVRIGVSSRIPHWNASGHGDYVDHYDEESRQIIADLYRRDIEAFGYEFGK